MILRQRLAILWPLPWLFALLGLVVHLMGFELWRASAAEQCHRQLLVGTDGACASGSGGRLAIAFLAIVAAVRGVAIIHLERAALRRA